MGGNFEYSIILAFDNCRNYVRFKERAKRYLALSTFNHVCFHSFFLDCLYNLFFIKKEEVIVCQSSSLITVLYCTENSSLCDTLLT